MDVVVPQVAEEHLHHLIGPLGHHATHSTADISHQTYSCVTHLVFCSVF